MILGPLTVTVVNRGWDGATRDRHNNPVVSDLGSFPLTGCHLQQRSSAEDTDSRDSVDTMWLLLAPPIEPPQTISPLDRVVVDAEQAHVPGSGPVAFEIEGTPDLLDAGDGSVHHLELVLRAVKL